MVPGPLPECPADQILRACPATQLEPPRLLSEASTSGRATTSSAPPGPTRPQAAAAGGRGTGTVPRVTPSAMVLLSFKLVSIILQWWLQVTLETIASSLPFLAGFSLWLFFYFLYPSNFRPFFNLAVSRPGPGAAGTDGHGLVCLWRRNDATAGVGGGGPAESDGTLPGPAGRSSRRRSNRILGRGRPAACP